MSKVQELTAKYTNLKSVIAQIEDEVRQDEAMLTVKKDELKRKQEELSEHGVEFKSLKELREKKEELESKIEKQVEKMEEVLGIDGDIEVVEDFEDFEMEL